MGFKLRKRRFYLFLPAILGEVALERMFELLKIHLFWQALILLVIALFLTIWILKGNAIFHPSFYRSYRIEEITEIEVSPDITERITREKPIPEGKVLKLDGKKVKKRIRKKRFEL